MIIKQSGKFQPINLNGGHFGLVVSLKMIHCDLESIKIEYPTYNCSTLTSKIGFPDVIMPGDVRNDLFLTLSHGEFDRAGISGSRNVEITVSVLDSAGKEIENCLAGASGDKMDNSYRSMVLYHNNSPAWNETVRIFVPIDKFANAHIRFEFRGCSTKDKSEPKLFGFSFARLMAADGSTIPDGQHELFVYKCEDVNKMRQANYLKLLCSVNDKQAHFEHNQSFGRSNRESFVMKTMLCSTKLTQNSDLLSLLKWRNEPSRIEESLKGVLRLKDEELVKFLQDVLDALFAMFSTEDGNSTSHSGLVFHVLFSIFR
jgi:dedicator of cytokinesis protein 3